MIWWKKIVLKRGNACDYEGTKKTEMDLDEWSARVRDECEWRRPMCIQDSATSPGLAWSMVVQIREWKKIKLERQIGTSSKRGLNETLGLAYVLRTWGGAETVTPWEDNITYCGRLVGGWKRSKNQEDQLGDTCLNKSWSLWHNKKYTFLCFCLWFLA